MARALTEGEIYRSERLQILSRLNATKVFPEDTFRFRCQRDGGCCADPPGLHPSELSEIAAYLGMTKQNFLSSYCEIKPPYVLLRKEGYLGCKFLSRDNGIASCSIYEARPYRCRARPLAKLFSSDSVCYVTRCFGTEAVDVQEFGVREWIETHHLEEGWKGREDYFRHFNAAKEALLREIERKKSGKKRGKLERGLNKRELEIVMQLFGV